MTTPVFFLIAFFLTFSLVKIADIISIQFFKKPLWVHFYWPKRKLTAHEKKILRTYFPFYNKLSSRKKGFFEHRVATFIHLKNFVGRQGLVIDDEKEVRIAATATLLTFGMRSYKLPILHHILVYPSAFYSKINDEMHKGEFNPQMNTLVLSWEDFELGFANTNDKINLGIHELTHVIHLNSMQYRTNSARLFLSAFNEMPALLLNDKIKAKLASSQYFRVYSKINKYEFLAVVVESFFERPQDFKREFPQIYAKLKEMFNFSFRGY